MATIYYNDKKPTPKQIVRIFPQSKVRCVRLSIREHTRRSGAFAAYYQLTKTTGVKLWRSKRNANLGLKLQNKLASIGYAPEVKSGLIAVHVNGKIGWGYMTQTVKVGRCFSWKKRQKTLKKWGSAENFAAECKKVVLSSMKFLQWERCAIGRIFNDCHVNNWGAFRNRMVWIDFAHAGF